MASTAAPAVRQEGGMNPALKDALLSALVAFILLAPMLGMRTTSGMEGMTLEFHFEWVFLLTAIVFAGPNCGWRSSRTMRRTSASSMSDLCSATYAGQSTQITDKYSTACTSIVRCGTGGSLSIDLLTPISTLG